MKFGQYISQVWGTAKCTIQNDGISHILIGVRDSGSATGPSEAELKAALVRVNLVVAGKGIQPLVDSNLFDLANLTDMFGGYGRDNRNTDLSTVNCIIPLGIDLGPGVTLEVQITITSTVATSTLSLFTIDNGSRPQVRRYRTYTGSGTIAIAKAYGVFVRGYSATEIPVKLEGEKIRNYPYVVGNILFALDAKIESEFIYSRLVSEENPRDVELYPTESVSAFIIEAA